MCVERDNGDTQSGHYPARTATHLFKLPMGCLIIWARMKITTIQNQLPMGNYHKCRADGQTFDSDTTSKLLCRHNSSLLVTEQSDALVVANTMDQDTFDFLFGSTESSTRRNCSSSSGSKRRKRMVVAMAMGGDPRRTKYQENRRNGIWQEHMVKLDHIGEKQFKARYHMTKTSFNTLVNLLDITVDEQQSMRSTKGIEPITKEIVVACGLRFLGAEQYKSIADAFHMSDSSARRVVRMFIEAVNACDQLEISLPTHNELEEVAIGFTAVSSADNAFHGVVGAVDGFLCSRIQPNTIEVSNPADYFSYHYQMYGVNVQAVCDSGQEYF